MRGEAPYSVKGAEAVDTHEVVELIEAAAEVSEREERRE